MDRGATADSEGEAGTRSAAGVAGVSRFAGVSLDIFVFFFCEIPRLWSKLSKNKKRWREWAVEAEYIPEDKRT